jgi:hypothetical protein
MCESALCENVTTDNVLGKLNYYLKSIDAEYRTGLLVLPSLKVVSNEKVGGPGMCQSVPLWLGPRRSRFVSLSILLSSSILSISASAPVKQNE